jgi:6-phosphogluconolactonase
MAALEWHILPSRDAVAAALAGKVAGLLRDAIARRGTALLAVSGGTTPALFFQALSKEKLDWSRATVTLVDERIVPESSPRSNAGLVKANLLRNEAVAATFAGLYGGIGEPHAAATEARAAIAGLAFPLDAAILGMGGDGHTASFFPGAANLEKLLDPATRETVLPVKAEGAGEPRLTLTFPVLAASNFVALLIEGEDKKEVLDRALADAAPPFKPIRIVFDRLARPVPVYWTPG